MRYPLPVAVALAAGLSACASIVSENQSVTYIETDPEKARCELHGQDFKRVIETPNSIGLPAEAAPITVACKAPGYRTTTGTLDTKLDGWIFGNILFGGLVGIVIDAARGAGQKYPPRFSLVLDPESFASAAARDEFYDRQRKTAEDKWAKTIRDAESRCGSVTDSERSSCQANLDLARTEREKELKEIEARRLSARVGT
jgi:hypothetical protein